MAHLSDTEWGEQDLVGRRLPPHELTTENGMTSSAELLRPARGILLDLADSAALRAAIAPWSDRVDVVTGRVNGQPPDSPLANATAVLVRPDGYIAWAATDNADPAEALHRWFGAPAGSMTPNHP